MNLVNFLLNLCILSSFFNQVASLEEIVDLDQLFVVTRVEKRFVSFALDSAQLVRHWKNVNLEDSRLIELTRQLTPAYLRLGGTNQDNILFCPNHKLVVQQVEGPHNETINTCLGRESSGQTIITESDIKALGNFVVKTGTNLIYGLNALQRKGKVWDPTNSVELINYMEKLGIPVHAWELGNEPQRFPKVFNKTVSGKTLGRDFNSLRKLLWRTSSYSQSWTIGPDATNVFHKRSIPFLNNFMTAVNADTLHAMTIHNYYFSGMHATVLDFMNPAIMDKLSREIEIAKSVIQRTKPWISVWLGETSTAWGGGATNISDRFVSAFPWVLDKLGQSAFCQISVVIRQSLMSNSYGLLDDQYRPTPCYFMSYIYKQVVGDVVLSRRHNISLRASRKLRIYIHCASKYPGEIVIFGVNLDTKPHVINITGSGKKGSPIQVLEFLLTPHKDNLASRRCNLNGKLLQASKTGHLPKLVPRILNNSSFTVPPTSLGFWVTRNANLKLCTN